MPDDAPKKPDLRDACVTEAFRLIEDRGVEKLSLREVARRLGVSHQAPYKHFDSRDHILAAVVARCFAEFAAFMRDAPRTPGLTTLAERYLHFAETRPLAYRLMFNTPLPATDDHPEMLEEASAAFGLLHKVLGQMGCPSGGPEAKLDALFLWSTIHGLASILQSNVLETIGLSEAEREAAALHIMKRLRIACAQPLGQE